MPFSRRKFVQGALLLPAISLKPATLLALAAGTESAKKPFSRVRPGDAAWPSAARWMELKNDVNGNLIKIEPPLNACRPDADTAACSDLFKELKNPYYIGDDPALTQTTGWLDAWKSEPSVYAVAASSAADVAAAVKFAARHHLRIVVKGGGHSYQGTSSAPDSLLVWTHHMKNIDLHKEFVAKNCEGRQAPQNAVTLDAGVLWLQAYNEVSVKAGMYVQGGGCTTVGVAGLVQGGGFGSFSKHYGTAAAALLEAEIVTADGEIKIANTCTNPDLFWALKGGGGGSFGIITKLTLRVRELPENFGAVFTTIKASGDKAYRLLIEQFMLHYKKNLFNNAWGEQVRFSGNNTLSLTMLFHGLGNEEAHAAWKPFDDWVKQSADYTYEMPLTIMVLPARKLWDTEFLTTYAKNLIATDDRPGASQGNVFWGSNVGEAGQFLYSYYSAWLPQSLLEDGNMKTLTDALFAASRYWSTSLHFNKGLAGAPSQEIAAAKDTAMNPDVTDAFALAIIAGENEKPVFAGVPGHEPDVKEGRSQAQSIDKAMAALRQVAPGTGSYLSESHYFEKRWQQSFWGSNYQKLSEVKKKYDPDGLFIVHHGVGSEEWSSDGFTRLV